MAEPSSLGRTLALLLGGILLLRLAVMLASGAGLHVDEAQYWDWSRHLAWGYWSKPPGIAALIAASTAVFGDGIAGVRLLSMAAWLAACGVLGALAWDMAGRGEAGRRAGLWSALLLAGTPAAGILGMAATTDAPLMLAWAACMYFSWKALATPQRQSPLPWWLLAGLALGLGLLSKYTMAALGASWALLFLRHWRRHGLGMVLAGLLGLALLGPNIAWNAANGWPTLGHTAEITVAAAAPAGGKPAAVAEFIAGQLLLLGPAALGIAWLIWGRRRGAVPLASPSGLSPTRFALAFALPLLLVALVQAINARAFMNWTAPALLGLCLWLGLRASTCLGRRALWIASLAGVLLPAALSLISLAPQVREYAQRQTPHLDLWARMRGWEPALSALAPAALEAKLPVAVHDRDLLVHARHVWRDQGLMPMAWPAAGRPTHHYEQFEALWKAGEPPPPALLLLCDGEPQAEQRQAYPHWQRLAQARWGRLDLQLWRASAAP